MRWTEVEAVPCPIARGMSVIGDAWTLLIVRDCFMGFSRFEEFQNRTKASRATLSTRLARLVSDEILERRPYQTQPTRYSYHLTQRGRALQPVMITLAHWAQTELDGELPPSKRRHTGCSHRFEPVMHCSKCGEPVGDDDVRYE